ncbi:hypothetical protein ACWDRB_02425 [Nonomuraea sp. NPDC003707]
MLGYYRSFDARAISDERRKGIEREAVSSGTRPAAITYVIEHPKAVKTALRPPTSPASGSANSMTPSAVSGRRRLLKPARPGMEPRPMRPWTSSTHG